MQPLIRFQITSYLESSDVVHSFVAPTIPAGIEEAQTWLVRNANDNEPTDLRVLYASGNIAQTIIVRAEYEDVPYLDYTAVQLGYLPVSDLTDPRD